MNRLTGGQSDGKMDKSFQVEHILYSRRSIEITYICTNPTQYASRVAYMYYACSLHICSLVAYCVRRCVHNMLFEEAYFAASTLWLYTASFCARKVPSTEGFFTKERYSRGQSSLWPREYLSFMKKFLPWKEPSLRQS